MTQTIDELFESWKKQGENLMNNIDAEHDAVSAQIEQQRFYLGALKEKRRELARRLGIEERPEAERVIPAELPPNGRPFKVQKMTRAEQARVPVEVIRKKAESEITLSRTTTTKAADGFLTSREALILVAEHAGVELTAKELVERAMKLGAWKESTLKVEVSKAAGDGVLTKREIEGQKAFVYGPSRKKAA